jgi:CAAX prenyl protease-like protein
MAEPMPAAESPVDHGPARPWRACLVPFVVFTLGGMLEPTAAGGGLAGALGIPPAGYPVVYTLKLLATAVAVGLAWPDLARWVGRPTWWPPLLGLALVVPWVVLAVLQREAGWGAIGGSRSGFDPWGAFPAESPWGPAFLAVRFAGLVVLVPIVEELFLRGFLMRYVVRENFWEVPFGWLAPAAAAACGIYAVATHPGEAVAALGWFAVVSGIAAATRRPIDCILAHAATNLALGAYIVATGNWWLW